LPDGLTGWQTLVRQGATSALEALVQVAAARQVPIRDLATTLLLAVATPHSVAALQIGDGAVVACGEDGRCVAITRPEVGEFFNETVFLLSEDAIDRAQVTWQEVATRGLAVFTDGLQMLSLKMPEGEPSPAFFDPLVRFAASAVDQEQADERLARFLQSSRFTERTDDDLTLVLASRGSTVAEG
jgi:hypothetical protein